MGGVKKPFLELRGMPVLEHALRPFLSDPRTTVVVVALADEEAEAPPTWLSELDPRIRVVAGGATRTESVRRALGALPAEVDVIAVHDGARPFVTPEVVRACLDLAATGVGAVAGTPAVDTMKRVGEDGVVLETPPRETLWHAQTPQVFPADALRRAYGAASAAGSDDAALVEATGLRVRMVDAGARNFKVTRPADLALGEAMLRYLEAEEP